MRILVVEDDVETAAYLLNGLAEAGHVAEKVADGRDGLARAMDEPFDILVVDRMLPGLDGLSLVKTLRAVGNKVPVLFLTSLGGVDDRVDGLDVGGDDYLVKPFAFSELMARVNALARRPHLKDAETVLRVGDLEMDLIARKVTRGGLPIDLQPREFRLLEVLMRNKGRVLTRTMLLERVWSFHFEPRTSVVETHISRLRTKVDRPYAKELIHTVRGSGYTMHDQP
jgi:two-component system OmpR family response regulator